jgi:signal peptidase I
MTDVPVEAPPPRRPNVAVLVIGAVVLVAITVSAWRYSQEAFETYQVPSESMVPALKIGDRILAESLSYEIHDPNRGDVVVFDAPPEAEVPGISELVQRVVGMPGETIEGRGGRIYIDREPLREPYLPEGVQSRDFGPVLIPADEYFVMGDNRQFSKDSTYYGPISRSTINGRMYLRYWPPGRAGIL